MQFNKNEDFYISVISNDQSFISLVSKIVDSLGENLGFLIPLGFDIQRDSDLETSKIKHHSIRASKRYLNEKHLIYG